MSVDLRDVCVLIVEDNVRNYALLARLLSFMGVKQTEWKRSGWHVLEFAQDTMSQIDLILLDIHLPEEDGYEVLARIREDEHYGNTRVVAVTADVSNLELGEAVRVRDVDFGEVEPLLPPERALATIVAPRRAEVVEIPEEELEEEAITGEEATAEGEEAQEESAEEGE